MCGFLLGMGEIQGISHLTVLIRQVNSNSKNIAGSSVRSSHSLLLTSTESAFSGQVAWLRFCAIIEGRLGLWDYSFGDHAPISPGEGTVQSTNFEFSVRLRRDWKGLIRLDLNGAAHMSCGAGELKSAVKL